MVYFWESHQGAEDGMDIHRRQGGACSRVHSHFSNHTVNSQAEGREESWTFPLMIWKLRFSNHRHFLFKTLATKCKERKKSRKKIISQQYLWLPWTGSVKKKGPDQNNLRRNNKQIKERNKESPAGCWASLSRQGGKLGVSLLATQQGPP